MEELQSAFNQSDYSQALALALPLAEQNHCLAQEILGNVSVQGF